MVRIKIISAIRLVLIALLIHSLLPSLGSAQIPTWTSIGPEGGWVRAFVQDPSNSQVMYLIGDGGRRWVYKSTDKGQTWTNISMIWESIYTLAIDPKNPSILYAGGINDVHKSVDGGFTWTTQDFNKRDSYVNDVIVDPNDSDIIHTCGYYWNGSKSIPFYYRSTDAGVTWSCHHPVQDQHYANAVAVDPNNSDVIYLGCRGAHGKVYKSTNGGQDWTDISSIINREIHDIEIDPTNSNNVIAASYSSIYRSTNRGDTWMKNNGNAYGYKLAFDPYNPNIIYAAYYNLCFRSTDGGISWNNISSGLYGYNCYSLIVDWESPENIFIATRAGVFRSHNSGGSWTHSNSGLLLARIDALKLAPSSPTTMYIAFADNAVYKTTNAIGKTGSQLSFEWTRLPEFLSCGDITSFAIAPDNPDVLYALEGYG